MPAGVRSSREPWSEDRVLAIVAAHEGERGPLLPILHDIRDTFGYVDPRAVPIVAEALNLSRAEVHGVVTFYRDFRTTPGGTVELRICRAEACQSVGADALVEDAVRAVRGPGRGHDRGRDADRGRGLLPGRLRARTGRDDRRRGPRPDGRASGWPPSSPRRSPDDDARLRPARYGRPLRRGGRGRRVARHPRPRSLAGRHDRPQRIARPALAGAARRGRDARGPDRLRTGRARATSRRCSMPGS